MTLTQRIELVQSRKKRQLLVAALLTIATTAITVSAVINHTAISIVSAAVVAGCMLFQWTIFFVFQTKEEIYTVMREQLGSGEGTGDQ
jgi:hypothetical protein